MPAGLRPCILDWCARRSRPRRFGRCLTQLLPGLGSGSQVTAGWLTAKRSAAPRSLNTILRFLLRNNQDNLAGAHIICIQWIDFSRLGTFETVYPGSTLRQHSRKDSLYFRFIPRGVVPINRSFQAFAELNFRLPPKEFLRQRIIRYAIQRTGRHVLQ